MQIRCNGKRLILRYSQCWGSVLSATVGWKTQFIQSRSPQRIADEEATYAKVKHFTCKGTSQNNLSTSSRNCLFCTEKHEIMSTKPVLSNNVWWRHDALEPSLSSYAISLHFKNDAVPLQPFQVSEGTVTESYLPTYSSGKERSQKGQRAKWRQFSERTALERWKKELNKSAINTGRERDRVRYWP